MKVIFFAALQCLLLSTQAQQKEGRVVYTRTMQMQVNINANDPMAQMLPKSQTDKFELSFAGNRSLWKHMDEEDNGDELNGNGIQLRMITPGQNDIVFTDFATGMKTEQREVMDRKFIITDSIRKLDWKFTGETQTLLGHTCQQATAQRVGRRMQMTMDNGKLDRKEMADTAHITAWFTTDVPVAAGPEVPGQLPGLILALDINHGRMVYTATELLAKADVADIREPSKGKKVTPDEYLKETAKLMDEMKKNNPGGDRRIVHMGN